ncbi:TIGR04283 family arsenosugar biosynthesis glycosyltransferase [Seonamhaeicola sp. NFXS20]|uniref:TIGR04283 family arsenosugar biosynthesis glycosyltransferase n=1 Tax=Seonamhaeicola sp. NFXS20 TaxID=2816959 RepID=UPI003B8D3805
MSNISIIIPILNEAETIVYLLKHLLKNSSKENLAEIIVVDGGSTDNSQKLVTQFTNSNLNKPSIKLILSAKGRAKQMNTGAKFATGNILYFLHADSFPPKHFDQLIINEIKQGHLAGCFRLQFNNKHWWLQLASWFTQFNRRICRGGDQSQFITTSLFNDIGGYDENYIIYEDNILINELYKRKQFSVINKKLITSARRYQQHGIWKLQYHFWIIYLKKWLGASANELHEYYRKYVS